MTQRGEKERATMRFVDRVLKLRNRVAWQSLLLISPAENGVFPGVIGFRCKELRSQAHRVVILASGEAMPAKARSKCRANGVQRHSAFGLVHRLRDSAHGHQIMSIVMAD